MSPSVSEEKHVPPPPRRQDPDHDAPSPTTSSSTKSPDTLTSSTKSPDTPALIGIQSQHMPKEYQSLFLWDDIIIAKAPPKQQASPAPSTQTKPKSLFRCQSCIFDSQHTLARLPSQGRHLLSSRSPNGFGPSQGFDGKAQQSSKEQQ